MELKVKKNSVTIIMIFMILLENCFYLIDTNSIHITGAFAYSDIWLAGLFFYSGYQWIKYLRLKTECSFRTEIGILVGLIFISAYQQMKLTGQSMTLGLRPQRNYLIILLAYFPLRKMFVSGKINSEELLDSMLKVGTFSATLYLIQKLTIDHIQFLNVIINQRNGARFYVDSTLIQITAIIAIYRFGKSYRIKYFGSLIICILYEFLVSQGRLEIMSVLVSVVIGFLMTRKMNRKKFFSICGLILVVFVFLNSSYADDLWQSISTMGTTTAAQGNTMEIRLIGRVRYAEQLTESFQTLIFGCGYPNMLYEPAALKAGYHLSIGLNDNGMYGFTYIYGLLGVAVIVLVSIKFLKRAYCIYKANGNTIYLMYMILNICLAYNIIFWYWKSDGTFILVLMMCLLEQKFSEECIYLRGNQDG